MEDPMLSPITVEVAHASFPRPFLAAMEDPMLSPVTVEVAHASSPWADLVAGHVAPGAIAQAHVAPSQKRQGTVVVQGGNPAAPVAAARAPGANAAMRSRPAAQKAGKAAAVKRRKVPASRKTPYSTSDFTPPPPARRCSDDAVEQFRSPRGRGVRRNGRKVCLFGLGDSFSFFAISLDSSSLVIVRYSGGSNNATNEFMNMLDTNAVDIDQASFEPFNYNETDGGVDDYGAVDELEEIEAEAFEQWQSKGGKSQRSKNYTILEDQALIQAWSAVSLDACTSVSQTAKRYWPRIEDQYFRIMKKESPPKRGSLVNIDEDEDDDGPRNLHKPDGDKKTKEKMKREQEATSLREKIDTMVQSNELMLLKSLEIKKELAEKKAKDRQEKRQMLKEEGLRKAAIEERKARASETKSMSLLLAEENKIMSMNRNDMDDLTKTWHDMARSEILKRRMVASIDPCSSCL
ncbi:Lactation elevated protein 1 [Hordeum vulgare]|nr:Lactation elevated protein 1 [Hordeum vulgare]